MFDGLCVFGGAIQHHLRALTDGDQALGKLGGIGTLQVCAALAGLAGMMAGPILSIEVGMGEPVLILAFIVIVIGGIGSIKCAFVAAVLVGLVDTFGRVLLSAGISSMSICILMAGMLCWRPKGLFPAHG